jgi:D-inositol-3-phosphate glycosyltransferase
MTPAAGSTAIVAWIVDPISHSGMAYYDAGLADALAAAGVRVTIAGSDHWLLPDFRAVTVLPLFRGTHGSGPRLLRGIHYVQSVARVVARLRRDRVPIAHWQYIEIAAVDLGAFMILRATGVRVVLTLHETTPWDAGKVGRVLARLLARAASAVIVHHPEDLAELDRMGVSRSRVSVIQHGDYALFARPDLTQSEARTRLGLGHGPLALFFGSIRPSKGVDDLVEAWAQVQAAEPRARLAIVGPTYRGHGPELAGHVRTMGLEDSVLLRLGTVDPEVTNAWYRAADVVVLPYREITTSGVLRYAYSSGRTVVATAVGEHRDLVSPGVTGELVPVQRPDVLAATILERFADPEGTVAMGQSALALVRRELGWEAIGRATADLYRSLLEHRGSGRRGPSTR